MAKFEINKKVVAISNFEPREYPYDKETPINKGDVLTIREITTVDNRLHFTFKEIINPILKYRSGKNGPIIMDECRYDSIGFIPIEETFKRISLEKVMELVEIGEN